MLHPREFFCLYECNFSVSFNKATMAPADDLICVIRVYSVSGIRLDTILVPPRGLFPFVNVRLYIISQNPFLFGFIVQHPPTFRKYLGVLAQAPIYPSDHIAYLEPGVLDPYRHPVLCPRPRKGQQVASWFEHAKALDPNRFGRYVVVPTLPHER